MRHIMWKRIIAAAVLFCCLSASSLYAETTQKDIDKTKNQIDKLENQKEEAEEAVDGILNQKDSLEAQLGKLNGQMEEIAASMNELEGNITAQEEKIAKAQSELEDAERKMEEQYAAMKVRIQYMYENSFTSLWQSLLEASSVTDFLNRTEYITELNLYDRKKLVEFTELKEQIIVQKAGLEQKKEELLALKEEMTEKQDSVNQLIRNTKTSIAQSEQELSEAQSDVEELETKIARMKEYEKELEIKKAKEDAARLAAIKKQEKEDYSGVNYAPAESDAYLLGAIIECEAGAESYEGKLAVGSVIMNRVKSSYFPNTVSGVIYQSGQFSPVASGRLAYRLQAGVDNACLAAAQEVLNGKITVSCLYFCVNNGIISGTVIGNHVFY